MGFYVAHADKPKMTWQRLWEILIGYIDHDLDSADIAYIKEFLYDLCTPEELKELGIWNWLAFADGEDE